MASDINVDDLENINEAMGEQIKLTNQLTNAWKKGSAEINRANQAGASFTSTFGKQMQQTGSVTKSLASALRTAAKDTKRFGKYAGLAAGALRGMAKASELAGKAVAGIQSGVISLTKSFIKLNVELMLAPIKITNAMMKMADEVAKARIPVAQASQDLAKQFGSQADGLRKMAKEAAAAEGELGNMFTFMSGQEFAAMGEAAANLGDTFNALAVNGMMPTGRNAAILNNVLGLGATEMQALGTRALATGKSLNDFSDSLVQQSFAMMEATGVAQKVIAQDIGGIMADVANFGNITVETAAVTAARLRTLGTSFKSLSKITNKFMNFDSAAQSAASLGQAFGIALNPMRMMKDAAKDPIKNLENLRKSMFNAGKSSEKMNAAELRLLATQTGLSEQEAQLMFSMKNRGKSVKDLKKASKEQKSDAEKMQDAVKNLTNEFAKMIEVLTTGGVFENLTKGFGDFMKSKGDLSKFQDLNEAMYRTGMKLGEAFQKFVDSGGLDAIVNAISKLEPLVNGLMRRGGFFDKLADGDLSGAADEFGKVFKEVFGMGLMEGIMAAGDKLAGMAAVLIEKLAEGLADPATFKAFEEGLAGGEGAATTGFGKLFSAWGKFFKEAWPYIELLLKKILTGIANFIRENPKLVAKIGLALLAVFNPMMLVSAGVAAASFATNFIGGLATSIGNGIKGGRVFAAFETFLVSGSKAGNFFLNVYDKIAKAFGFLGKAAGGLGRTFQPVLNIFSKMFPMTSALGGAFAKLGGVIGKFALPLVVAWEAGKKIVGWFQDVGTAISTATGPLDAMLGIFSASWKAVLGFAGAMADFFTFGFFDFESAIVDNWDAFTESLHYFFVELPKEAFGKMWESAKEVAGKIGGVFSAAWQGIKDGAAAIGDALVAPFVWAWEKIKSTWSWLWPGSASPMMVAVKDGIVAGADAIYDMLLAPFKKAAKFIKGAWNFAKNIGGKIKEGVGAAVGKAKELGAKAMKGLGSALKGGKKFLKGGFKFARNFFSGKYHKKFLKGAANLGKQAMKGLKNGMDKFKKDPVGSIKKVGKGIIGGAKKILKLFSPSKVFEDMGGNVTKGLKVGIDNSLHVLDTFGPDLIEAMGVDAATGELSAEAKGVQTALEAMTNILGGVKDIIDMMTSVPEALSNFDPIAAKADMKEKMTGFKDMMSGDDGMFSIVNDMGADMSGNMMKQLNVSAKQATLSAEAQKAYNTKMAHANKIAGMRPAAADSIRQNAKIYYEEQQALEQKKLNAEAMEGALEAHQKEQDLMNSQLDAVSKLANSMTSIHEAMQKINTIGSSLSTDMITAKGHMNAALENVLALLTDSATYNMPIAKQHGKFTALYDFIFKDGGPIGKSNGLVRNLQNWFLMDYKPDVMTKRIETARVLQGHLTELVAEINTINTIATGIPNIELKATIDDIEDSLSIVQEFTKIKDKPISLNFALDIHIEADKLAKAILQTETAQTHLTLRNTSTL